MFDFPTISKLTAFVYGVLLVSESAFKGEALSGDDDDEIFDWQSLDTTSTIVKLRTGRGEPPLIILHGMYRGHRSSRFVNILLYRCCGEHHTLQAFPRKFQIGALGGSDYIGNAGHLTSRTGCFLL